MSDSETRLQSYILAQLSLLPGCFFWRQNTGFAMTVSGRGLRFGIPGQADITGVARGRRVEIEVKSDSGKQSAEQSNFQSKVEGAGALYIVARSLEDALLPVQQLLKGSCK